VAVAQLWIVRRLTQVPAMNTETAFLTAFWVQLGLMILMRLWFAFRVRQAGERLMPDQASIRREGWWVFALRFCCFVVLVVLVVLALQHRFSFRRFTFPLPWWLRWAAFVVGLVSLGLWTWTHLALGRYWSAQLQLRAGHRLITDGPYSRVRHPMYSAVLGWVAGLGLLVANWFVVVFVMIAAIILIRRIPREEKMMLERFGDEYKEYKKRTGRFLPLCHASHRAGKMG